MSGTRFVTAGLLGMLSAPAACFLLGPKLLPAVLLFPLLGTLRWGWRWIATLAAVCLAPLLITAWSLWTGRDAAVLPSVRWALSAGCGVYFARRTGAGAIGHRLRSFEGRMGVAGRLLSDLGTVLSASGPMRDGMKGVRIPGTPPAEILRKLDDAITVSTQSAPPPAGGDRSMMAEAGAAWALLLAGTAGF